MYVPIEENRYAAYYDIEKLQPESRVPIPTLEGVVRAKEWVEEIRNKIEQKILS